MKPQLVDGWLIAAHPGKDNARIELAIGAKGSQLDWKPAFRDYHDGERIVKIRPSGSTGIVWLRVDGRVSEVGRLK